MSKQAISTNRATIRTATIQVKVIRIDNRQMTLSVFRQLEQLNIIDGDTGELLGHPWGIVRYCPDTMCKEIGSHIHVVWQVDNLLFRSTVVCPHNLFANSSYNLARAVSHLPVEEWGNEERDNYGKSWEQLCDLDQLFIAI